MVEEVEDAHMQQPTGSPKLLPTGFAGGDKM